MRGSLCGYVVRDGTGRPVEAARVEATASGAAVAPVARTDSSGWFVLDGLPPGYWRLQALAPDNARGAADAPVFAHAFSDVTIRVGDGDGDPGADDPTFKQWVARMQHGSMNGRVVRAGTGEPVADATVTIVVAAGPVPDIAPLTDEDGRFRLDGLPPGDWTLLALGARDERGQATVRVPAGGVAEVTIVLPC